MPNDVRVHLYCLCWNDARMLPYFFRHYDEFVDEYFVYDNGSTDGSLDLLKKHGRVNVEHFDVRGDSFVDEERRLSDEIWQRSRGKADWVIVTDIDEHLYRPDLIGYLGRCQHDGVTAIRSIGYEMVSAGFPPAAGKLTELVTNGCRSVGHNRLCIFNPDAITATHYGPGRHQAWPEGHVVWPTSAEVLLLHYKQLGTDYVISRSAELAGGIKTGDIENGWGMHYTWSADEIKATWNTMNDASGPVPGLGKRADMDPADYRGDEKIVEESGLLDTDWYMSAYQDVVTNRADPSEALTHFCLYGWKEGRMPNMYFDPVWYLDNNPGAVSRDQNPLVDYALKGERAGRAPSPHFDPVWYRAQHSLTPDESPLRHYLLRRYSGRVSPLPGFELEEYLRLHPEVQANGRDPYEDYVERAQAPDERSPTHLPTFGEITASLGFDAGGEIFPAQVPWASMLEIIRRFLRTVPVDEAWYRAANPDVDAAITAGEMVSARGHFIDHGYFEGRSPHPSVQAQGSADDGQ